MADVKSFRISDVTHEQLKQIAGNQSMDETFRLLLSAYNEKQAVRNDIDSARLKELDSLCMQLKSLFHGILDSQATEYERIRQQNGNELDQLHQTIDSKNQELQKAEATIQSISKKLEIVQAENNVLKELNNSLKSENSLLKQNINLLNNKKTATKKKSTIVSEDSTEEKK